MTDGDPPPDGSHGPHVLVADITTPTLDDDSRHHLERVLRVGSGDPLTVSDGAGGWRECRMGAEPEPTSDLRRVVRPTVSIAVAFALIKGGRPELVVQKLTELGVDEIVPFAADRSVVRWDGEKAGRNADRLRRVAREAVMQSRRCWIPEVADIVDFTTVAGRPEAVMADHGGSPPSLTRPTILIGPEGGWTTEERECGLPAVALGSAILRAETAAMTAGAVLAALRDGLVAPVR